VKRLLAIFLVLVTASVSSAGQGKPARTKPQGPAAWKFAKTVPGILDSEWHWKVGGFGGIRPRYPLRHVPVIFVHGNNVDAADWYPVRDDFRAAGWSDQELWGISYGGLGGANGTALFTKNPERDQEHMAQGDNHTTYITEDDVNVPDLFRFIRMVQAYTGSRRFVIVGHSLGVTLARKTLLVHRELRKDLVAFVSIAGPNHGTTFCPPGSEGNVVSCDEIAAGTPWLAQLNAGGETFGPARWLSIYDGTGEGDPAYVGPAYAQSPRLAGAVNWQYPHTYHNDLRLDPAIVQAYRTWIQRYATLP
jgi:pimeloyl-ACP methyl ester carboxylesterase